MSDLKKISTEELVKELGTRMDVKSAKFEKGESVKIVLSGADGTRERYIRESGPGIMIQVTKVKL